MSVLHHPREPIPFPSQQPREHVDKPRLELETDRHVITVPAYVRVSVDQADGECYGICHSCGHVFEARQDQLRDGSFRWYPMACPVEDADVTARALIDVVRSQHADLLVRLARESHGNRLVLNLPESQ